MPRDSKFIVVGEMDEKAGGGDEKDSFAEWFERRGGWDLYEGCSTNIAYLEKEKKDKWNE